MENEKEKPRRDFYNAYKKVRKPMPPSEKTIRPKNEYERPNQKWQDYLGELNDEDDFNSDNNDNNKDDKETI